VGGTCSLERCPHHWRPWMETTMTFEDIDAIDESKSKGKKTKAKKK
jgi:hypothetical protein